MKCYEKRVLATKTSPEGKALYDKVRDLTGREYNRAVSSYIIDDLLAALDDQQALSFLPHIPVVLPLLQAGMFDTACQYLAAATVSEDVEKIKETLIQCLRNADAIPLEVTATEDVAVSPVEDTAES